VRSLWHGREVSPEVAKVVERPLIMPVLERLLTVTMAVLLNVMCSTGVQSIQSESARVSSTVRAAHEAGRPRRASASFVAC